MAVYEKLSSNKAKLTFTVPAAQFDEAVEKAYRKNVRKINIPGFRKGKAPLKVIENYYGASVFYEDALDILFPEVYSAGVKEHDLKVVDRPEIDVTKIGKGQDLEFTCEVYVQPDVTLGAYKDLGIEKHVAEVTDDDVMAEIERVRERQSRFIPVTDRAAKLDDQVNIDYEGWLGDEQFEGGTAKGHDLVLGSGSFIPGFEEQLVGKNAGEECEVNVTFPAEYHAENLAGKAVVFKVKINSIQEKEVPALDDEFVKDVSETAETVDQYKAEVRADLEKKAEEKADSVFENDVIEKVVENAEMDIPQAMIDSQVEDMMRDMEMRMMYQGMKLDDYFKYTGQTREQVAKMYAEPAEKRVRTQLTIDAVRKAEGIEATEEEVNAEIAKYAEQNKRTVEEFEKMLSDDDKKYFAEMATMQKTVDFLKANAYIMRTGENFPRRYHPFRNFA